VVGTSKEICKCIKYFSIHKLYYNVSQLFLESLVTWEEPINIFARFWQIWFWPYNILAVERFLFIVSTWVKRLTVLDLVCSKLKNERGKEIKGVKCIDINSVFFKTKMQKGTGTTYKARLQFPHLIYHSSLLI
jgi:hypothetical protein